MGKHFKKITQEVLTKGRTIALLGALLLVISAFLTWGYTENVRVTGLNGDGIFNGDGIITIAIGFLAFILLFIKRITIWISLLLGIVGLAVGVIDYVEMNDAVQQFAGHVGTGLYLTIAASVGIVLGVIVEMIDERKKKLNLYYIDENKE